VHTLLIRGGRVLDGTGGPWFRMDIAVKGDSISAMGDLRGENAETVIDADGLYVSPGFIDLHSHSDYPILIDGCANSHVRQGVTTEGIGNCGSSAAPLTDEMAGKVAFRRGGEPPNWRSYGEYIKELEKSGSSINIVPIVGQGAIRNAVMGYDDRPAGAQEIEAMKALVYQAMDEGCFGVSTGLIYTPSCYAGTDEIVELAYAAGEYGGTYFTHIRGENDTVIEAVAEAIEIGRRAGVPVHIAHLKAMGSHMWGKSVDILGMIDGARREGIEVTFDQYPYTASATGLSAVLPPWAHVGGTDKLMERLADHETRARMRRDIEKGVDGWFSLFKGVGWENILITGNAGEDETGKSVAEIARKRGKDGFDTCFDLLSEHKGQVRTVFFNIGDEDLERIMRHPAGMIGSDSSVGSVDGPLRAGKPHPRGFGTFVRVLGHYVREKRTITLEEAVRKMTSAPAAKLRLPDRGILRPGMKADIVVFDADTVADKATYVDPFQYPVGIELVTVNGSITVRAGAHTGEKAGRVLRRGR
jgi:N-acyl-D-amino-acid deacylase